MLANNAGGLFDTSRQTVDGHGTTFQVNHLTPFLLTNLLLETLKESRASVIHTASVVAKRNGNLNLDDLENRRDCSPIQVYSNAKLENILFTKELHHRYADHGISAVAFHPGNVASNFASDTTTSWRFVYKTPLRHVILLSPRKGSEPLIWLAESQPGRDWQPGASYEKHEIAATNPQADDPGLAAELWERSAATIGLATC